jgi:hypothetical protein
MTGEEHFAEAERLLEKAKVPYIVTLPDNMPMDSVHRIQTRLTEWGMDDALVGSESVRIDLTPVLLAAQVHATLALAADRVAH